MTEEDYDFLVSELDILLNKVKDDETHYLMPLVNIISNLMCEYEIEHF